MSRRDRNLEDRDYDDAPVAIVVNDERVKGKTRNASKRRRRGASSRLARAAHDQAKRLARSLCLLQESSGAGLPTSAPDYSLTGWSPNHPFSSPVDVIRTFATSRFFHAFQSPCTLCMDFRGICSRPLAPRNKMLGGRKEGSRIICMYRLMPPSKEIHESPIYYKRLPSRCRWADPKCEHNSESGVCDCIPLHKPALPPV